MAQKALVFIERVFRAPEPVLVLQLGMALPASIFVAVVFTAPEPAFLAQTRITDKALFLGCGMGCTGCTVGLRLSCRRLRLRVGRRPLLGRLAGRKQSEESDEPHEHRSVSCQVCQFHDCFLTWNPWRQIGPWSTPVGDSRGRHAISFRLLGRRLLGTVLFSWPWTRTRCASTAGAAGPIEAGPSTVVAGGSDQKNDGAQRR